MRALKLIAINAAVFLSLILLANLVLAIAFEAKDYVLEDRDYRPDPLAAMPNYEGQDWARIHSEESDRVESSYRSYYGWRPTAFEGETITIESSGLRRTVSAGDAMRIGFFGGSAMWGAGARDDETIPSYVAGELNAEAVNFGVSAWRAHQSLNRLMEAHIAGETFDFVVFYDGVNEVSFGCRADAEPFSHGRQRQIAEHIAAPFKVVMRSFFAPLLRFTTAVARRVKQVETAFVLEHDCSRDPAKAAHIARMLAADWDMARFIAGRMGAHFIGVLQPVVFFSDTPIDHIDFTYTAGEEAEFRTVYPLVRQALETISGGDKLEYIDMTDALNTPAYVYTDFVHLSPNGNAMVADRLAEHIRSWSAATSDRD